MKNLFPNLLVLSLITSSFFGCVEEGSEQAIIDNKLDFKVLNESNDDLLDSNTTDAINIDNIKLFYIIDGQLQEVYDPLMDYPKNFFVFNDSGNYRIRLFLNSDENEELPETIIQWTENEADTIKAEFKRGLNSLLLKNVWVNGELGEFNTDDFSRTITLIK